jgi:hypothetical protein
VTVFGILFTPVFYYVIRKMTGHGGAPQSPQPPALKVSPATHPVDEPVPVA